MAMTTNPKQRVAIAIAEKNRGGQPVERNTGQLVERNGGMLRMRHGQLQDFNAAKGLARTLQPKAALQPATRFRLVRATGMGTQRNKLL